MKVRKIFLGAFAVGAVALTLTTSTYAWFRIGSNAYVNNLEFKVISGLGFKVSVDGTNSAFFTDTLDTSHMTSAILHKYNPNKYVIYKNHLFEKEELEGESAKYTLLDSIYEDKKVTERTDSEQADVVNCTNHKIELVKELIQIDLATTMKVNEDESIDCDGFTLYNEFGEEITDNSKYLEFDLYFKTESDKTSDNLHFGIYITGETSYDPYNGARPTTDGSTWTEKLIPTSISSGLQTVKLLNTLSYLKATKNGDNVDYEAVNLKAKDKINIDIANAMRFAKKDNGEITVSAKPTTEEGLEKIKALKLDDNKSFIAEDELVTADDKTPEGDKDTYKKDGEYHDRGVIYEIPNDDDLGSYATTYDGDDDNLNRLYNSNYNAMWTYYQSLGAGDESVKPLNYEKFSKLYDTFEDEDGNEMTPFIFSSLSDSIKLTKLDSGLKAHKVTFRFWLEGYDADYIAGVSGENVLKGNFTFKVNSQLT